MRIVLIGAGMRPIPPVGYGGVERTIAEFSIALRHAGDEVSICNQVYPGRAAEYRFARQLPALRAEFEGRVVHAHTPVVANRLARLRIPFAYTTHSRHWFVREGFTQRLGYRLERRAVDQAATTIALSEVLRREILAAATRRPSGPVTTVPLGVDLQRFSPRGSLGDGRQALAVGTVLPIKRWELAARALAGTGIRLRLAGPQPDRDYADAVRAAGPVDLLGEISDDALLAEFQRADFLIHPSRVEVFPGVVAQAMACGLPVVGTAVIAPPVEEGVTGLVVAGGSDEEIVRAISAAAVRLRDNPELRETLGRAGRARAERDFDWGRIVEAHHALYLACGLAQAP
ncbi:MAG: glycosyltransferase family 4 protein [Thermoplasmata archaeon]